MCGIAGIVRLQGGGRAEPLAQLAGRMADTLQTRGPDAGGVWEDAGGMVALSHRRLSILDISAEGAQPMVSASGRYVISFNGEIYNYQRLRAQLQCQWRGHSDTEVLLAAIEQWGIAKALEACNGMFAFAVWDNSAKTLTLARDRLGEKPVYYGCVAGNLAFASELKAFRVLPGFAPTLNPQALALLLRYSYIAAPYSIYQEIKKLQPGHFVVWQQGQQAEPEQVPYWSLEEVVVQGQKAPFVGNIATATDQLEILLKQVVQDRMVADVPLGAFLSGGVDSSTVVALMQAQSTRAVKTYTIGFQESGFDEAPFAKAVAAHLGTEHHELYVSAAEAQAIIPQLPESYDEPFADSSQIPTFLVSRFARQQVTVALSGDGGDELFGGYQRYTRGPAIWRVVSALPYALRGPMAQLLQKALGQVGGAHPILRKCHNYLAKIATPDEAAFYRALCSLHDAPLRLLQAKGLQEIVPPYLNKIPGLSLAERTMLNDMLTYFPGDILTKVDRAAMANSLETRTPFTDPELIALAWQMPQAYKIHQKKGKYLLRQVLYRHVPEALIERPKAGFAVPIGAWLRGPLKPWAADLLSPEMLARQGHFDAAAVSTLWQQHQSGAYNHEHRLWNILMFQAWLSANAA